MAWAGEWLIDPFNLEIVLGNIFNNVTSTNPFSSIGTVAQLGVDLIFAGLQNGNVTITTGTSGTEAGNITWNADAVLNSTSANSLSVNANGTIFFNANITTQGAMTFDAGQSISVDNANLTGQGPMFFSAPSMTLDNANLNSNNNTINVRTDNLGSPNDFEFSNLNSGLGSVVLTPFTQGAGLDIGTGPGILSSNADLSNFLTAANLVLGDQNTGPVTVVDTFINSLPVQINGSLVSFDLSSTTGSSSFFNNLTVNSGTDIFVNAPLTDQGFLTLNTGVGGGEVTVNAPINAAGGLFFFSGNLEPININADITTQGQATFDAGTLFNVNGATINTNNNPLLVIASNMALAGILNSGTASTSLLPQFGASFGLGAGAGGFSISDAELDSIFASLINIGNFAAGPITVDGASSTTPIVLSTGSTITFSGAPSDLPNLTTDALGGVINGTQPPPVIPPVIIDELEQQEVQGENSFVTNLLENAEPAGC